MDDEKISLDETPHVDRLKVHLKRVASLPSLTAEEEILLVKKWHDAQDERARQKILERHQRLVLKVAQGYKGYGLPIGDLVSEGNIGMMQALAKFDVSKGFRFSTYALWWIKASIKDFVMKNWSLVRIGTTTNQKKLFFKVRSLMETFERQGINLSQEEIAQKVADHLDVPLDEVLDMILRLQGQDSSLNSPVSASDEGSEWLEWIADDENHAQKVAHEHELRKQRKFLSDALQGLNQRESQIITWRRLLEPPLTLDDCGEKLDLSKERVRQIEASAFEKLQKSMRHHAHEELNRRRSYPL